MYDGISYVRTTRPKVPVVYTKEDEFVLGGSTVWKETRKGKQLVTIIAAGVTVHEALIAKKELEGKGIPTRVIDCYSVKPIDESSIREAAVSSNRLIIVEDHYSEGGLGEQSMQYLPVATPLPQLVFRQHLKLPIFQSKNRQCQGHQKNFFGMKRLMQRQ